MKKLITKSFNQYNSFNNINKFCNNLNLFKFSSTNNKKATKNTNSVDRFDPKIHPTLEENLSKQQKEQLKNTVINNLKDKNLSPNDAKEFETNVRTPTYGFNHPEIYKISSDREKEEQIKDDLDKQLFIKTMEQYDRLVTYHRESKYELNDVIPSLKKLDKRPVDEILDDKLDNYILNVDNDLIKKRKPFKPHGNDEPNVNLNSDIVHNVEKRFDLDYNYNFEQNETYTRVYNEAKLSDNNNIKQHKKVIKFMKENPDSKITKSLLNKHFSVPLDMVEDKYKDLKDDLEVLDKVLETDVYSNKKQKRNIIPKHSSELKDYDLWRVFDKELAYFINYSENAKRIKLSPYYLQKLFGHPGESLYFNNTGHYYFEDSNLDTILIFDHCQTTKSFGPNQSEEIYEKEKEYDPSARHPKSLTPEEYWNSKEEKEFRIIFSNYTEFKRATKFLKREIENIKEHEINYNIDKILDDKFGKVDDFSDHSIDRTSISKNKTASVFEYSFDDINELNIVSSKDNKKEKNEIDNIDDVTKNYKFNKLTPVKQINDIEGEMFDYYFYIKQKAAKQLRRENTKDDDKNKNNQDNKESNNDKNKEKENIEFNDKI